MQATLDMSWMLYHRDKAPQKFYSLEERQAAIDSGKWRDAHEEFLGNEEKDCLRPPTYSKNQLGRMTSPDRVAILLKYHPEWPEMSRDDEVSAILNMQTDDDQ